MINFKGWDYKDYPHCDVWLVVRSEEILLALKRGEIQGEDASRDTRPIHHRLFTGLTPDQHDYFAGNYRGSAFPLLKDYNVEIDGDPTVGVDCQVVDQVMTQFGEQISQYFSQLRIALNSEKGKSLSKDDKVLFVVQAAAEIAVRFLQIHPYANGNGHMGRFLIFSVLAPFGIWPVSWPFNDRPDDPPYTPNIYIYRRGLRQPLVDFILKAVLGRK